jgi:hypothetical protein
VKQRVRGEESGGSVSEGDVSIAEEEENEEEKEEESSG